MNHILKISIIALFSVTAACSRTKAPDGGSEAAGEPWVPPTVRPARAAIQQEFRAGGLITADPDLQTAISSRFDGRIEKLYVTYGLQRITAGQKLFEIYSPGIRTAREELSYLDRNDPGDTASIRALTERLALLGLTQQELRSSDPGAYAFAVYSPVSGFIGGDENPVKEGSWVSKGETVFRVTATSRVWAVLQVYPGSGGSPAAGDPVTLYSRGEEIWKGTIGKVEPVFRKGARTLSVRVYIDNHDGRFSIGQVVSAVITGKTREGLWIPSTALLALGNGPAVLRKTADGFVPVRVTTGMRQEDSVEVVSGLAETDEIARDTRFLFDSDTFIKDGTVWKR